MLKREKEGGRFLNTRPMFGLNRKVPGAYAWVRMGTHMRTHNLRAVRTQNVRTYSTHTVRIVRTHVRTLAYAQTYARVYFFLTNFKKNLLQKNILLKIQSFYENPKKKTYPYLLVRGLELARVRAKSQVKAQVRERARSSLERWTGGLYKEEKY